MNSAAASVGVLLRQALAEAASTPSSALDIQLLLAASLGCSRASLIARDDRQVEPEQRIRFDNFLRRWRQGEPVAYILGYREFWDFTLKVDHRVLIPRPETELLVEQTLDCLAGRENLPVRILDLGTGSGAIALALARHSPDWQVVAVERDPGALEVAKENSRRLHTDNVEFRLGNWFDGLTGAGYDVIVSNPPYVAPGDPHLDQHGLWFEPQQALVAAEQGLADLRRIASDARRFLNAGGWLLLEHGFQQREAVAAIMLEAGFTEVCCWRDLSGLDRVTAGRSPA